MPSLIFVSDLHLEAGFALGAPDAKYGNTRMRDAAAILRQIASEDVDVLLFGGDLGRTPRMSPLSYVMVQEAFAEARARNIVWMVGNHDYPGGTEATALHVLARAVPGSVCVGAARLVRAGGIQIGCLPWSPSSRLLPDGGRPRDVHRMVAERLIAVARGLASQVDFSRPSLLAGHWFVSGSDVNGRSVMEMHEPILPVNELEGSGNWDAILMGHNHKAQQVGNKVFVAGSPMRDSFGEQHYDTGYLKVTWGEDGPPVVERVPTRDVRLVTLDLDVESYLGHGQVGERDVAGAVVRLRWTCGEQEAAMMKQRADAVVSELYGQGALKVVGPQVEVVRAARKRVAGLKPDVDPFHVLGLWLDREGVEKPEDRERLIALARDVMEVGDEAAAS
jgi:DNA repair exonuclease SbcCD nuclease subunit